MGWWKVGPALGLEEGRRLALSPGWAASSGRKAVERRLEPQWLGKSLRNSRTRVEGLLSHS